MSKEKQIEKNCNECLHFEACCKWTDFPKQIGFPTCRKFAPISGYRKQSEWISVEERLPEEGGTYLVVLKEKHECEKEWNYHVDVASFTFEWDCIFHDWDEGQGIEITHWMPLPEPPKKGGGE